MYGLLPFVLAAAFAAQPPAALTGVIRDPTGAGVSRAEVVGRTADGHTLRTDTALDGSFHFPESPAVVELIVRAPGFAEVDRAIEGNAAVDITLRPASIAETVTVTATGTAERTGNLPAAVTIVTHDDIERSAAVAADDVLRQVPAFSLFRRSSSLASHPTTQGVSLRGIGPSGVSRTLVLLDGVPFNDPFGGWIYWTRVPLEAADRIEIVEGPASSLYGNYAMGGAINIVTATPATALDARLQEGTHATPRLDAAGGAVHGPVGVSLDVSALRTDGYPIVAAAERGAVDTNANVRYANGAATASYDPSAQLHVFARGGYLAEDRNNGRVSTIDGTPEGNDTAWRSASAGVRAMLPDSSQIEGTVFGNSEDFRSNFLAVPAATPARSVGRMTLAQFVPARALGAAVNWSRAFGGRQLISAGADTRWVKGDSDEDALDAATGTHATLHRVSGGEQRNAGIFIQDVIARGSRLTVTVGARADGWRNYDGHNLEGCAAGQTCTPNNAPSLAARRESAISPRAGVRYQLRSRANLWASASGGFRAPTLNELYRQFRVGSTLTLADSSLTAERLRGYEGGATITAARGLEIRATAFDDTVRDPVANVTISTTASTITQQRENLGRTRARGVEAALDWRWRAMIALSASYARLDSTVIDNPASPPLVGHLLPQVPRDRATVRGLYTSPRLGSLSAQVFFTGAQFDDDLNTPSRLLPRSTTVDLLASHRLRRGWDAFISAQNLFNVVTIVGTLPTTIGAPRLVSAGVTVRLRRRGL